jgi:hypothetical protein
MMKAINLKSILFACGVAAHESPGGFSKEELEIKWGTDVHRLKSTMWRFTILSGVAVFILGNQHIRPFALQEMPR